ncbi:hypothetical protein HanXRQr2_Chr04g0174921 [Helianthus annuus]|uniref:Uncharacterized protein n=1 Tax=Helianthus annuus TaxID=4232 RepID=A0A9K3J8R1_HELAN|nr:hypothetical protein HanXRQr2_Chr04g0174921 [Helianthus annuus]KAJ0932001.1 hypothetical protein HanPSC8_Chr04g0168541 [Helianthus annuus]
MVITLMLKMARHWLRTWCWSGLCYCYASSVEAHLFRFGTTTDEAQEEMLTGFILNLLHVKDLKIGSSWVKVLDRLKAKGFICPSNLKVLDGW